MLKRQSTHRVHGGCAFDNEALPDAVRGLHLQLVVRLEWHRSHGAATGGFGDRFGIVEVLLVRLQVGFHELSRDHAHSVSGTLEATSPVLRARPRLHGDDACWQRSGELRELRAIERLTKQRMAPIVHADEVEPVLAEIDPHDANGLCAHGGLPLKKPLHVDAWLRTPMKVLCLRTSCDERMSHVERKDLQRYRRCGGAGFLKLLGRLDEYAHLTRCPIQNRVPRIDRSRASQSHPGWHPSPEPCKSRIGCSSAKHGHTADVRMMVQARTIF